MGHSLQVPYLALDPGDEYDQEIVNFCHISIL